MTFTVNGKKVEIDKPVSISSYLDSIGVSAEKVVIELNYEIPDRKKWTEIILKDGDNVEIVKFIGGG